jgi:hypothetical protein
MFGVRQTGGSSLLAWWMIDLDRVSSLHARTRFTVRAEMGVSDLGDEARVAPLIAEPTDLVIQSRPPDMRIVGEPSLQVSDERFERVGIRPGTGSRRAGSGQIGPDGLSVPVQVAGDRRDGPAALVQSMCFHVFPMCEHAGRGSLRADCLVAFSIQGAHFRWWMVQLTVAGWGISVIEGGEFQ